MADIFDDVLDDDSDDYYNNCTAGTNVCTTGTGTDTNCIFGDAPRPATGSVVWMECESETGTGIKGTTVQSAGSGVCTGDSVCTGSTGDDAFDNQTANPKRSADEEEMLLAVMAVDLDIDLSGGIAEETCSDFEWQRRDIALCCLRTRKYDAARAVVLYRDFTAWRRTGNKEEAESQNIGDVWIFDELFTMAANRAVPKSVDFISVLDAGIFQVLGCADLKQRPVMHVSIGKYIPGQHSAMGIIQGLGYTVEKLLRAEGELGRLAQLKGICVLFDCKDAAFSNFDLFLPRIIFRTLGKKTPLRIGAILLLNMSSFFTTAVKAISVFLNEKLKKRLIAVEPSEALALYLPINSIPVQYGGLRQPANLIVEPCPAPDT